MPTAVAVAVVLALIAGSAVTEAACPHDHGSCGTRLSSCTPAGGSCLQQRCLDKEGKEIQCVFTQGVPQLPARALRAFTSLNQAVRSGRKLQQFAGVGNFLVGAGVAGFQRLINTAGAASQLANFYGVEGVGLRHRLGALPAPGGLELLALAGPAAMPGPEGFTIGWLGGTAEALAASANPMTVAGAGSLLNDMASSANVGQLVGASGLSGLGLGTGTAATAALDLAHAGGGGNKPGLPGLLGRLGLGGGGADGQDGKSNQALGTAVGQGLGAIGSALGGAGSMAKFAGGALQGLQKETVSITQHPGQYTFEGSAMGSPMGNIGGSGTGTVSSGIDSTMGSTMMGNAIGSSAGLSNYGTGMYTNGPTGDLSSAYSASLGAGQGTPGPIGQRAGVAGTLVGMAGDTAGQFVSDMSAARGTAAGAAGLGGLPGNLLTNTGAMHGELLTGAGHIAGQAVSAIGQVADEAKSVGQQVVHNAGTGTAGLFNLQGRFLGKLAELTGPGRNVATKTGQMEYVDGGTSTLNKYMVSDDGTTTTSYSMVTDGSGPGAGWSGSTGYGTATAVGMPTSYSTMTSMPVSAGSAGGQLAASTYAPAMSVPMGSSSSSAFMGGSTGMMGSTMPSANMPVAGSGTASLAAYQSVGGQIVGGGGMPTTFESAQSGQDSSTDSAQPAAAPVTSTSSAGMVSVTGPFLDTAAAFAAKG